MSTPSTDGLKQEIDAGRLRVGNQVQLSTGLPAPTTMPLWADSSSLLAAGGIFPLVAGVAATANAGFSIEGASTLTANDIMHQTLVAGAGVTTFTSQGFVRVAVVDDAGNITNGNYYVQFGTLS